MKYSQRNVTLLYLKKDIIHQEIPQLFQSIFQKEYFYSPEIEIIKEMKLKLLKVNPKKLKYLLDHYCPIQVNPKDDLKVLLQQTNDYQSISTFIFQILSVILNDSDWIENITHPFSHKTT